MKKEYHFIGIGGIGMSALARIVLKAGHKVTGSDLKTSVIVNDLQQSGANVTIGHKASIIPDAAEVVYATGVNEQNPEFADAKAKMCRLLHRSDLLAELLHAKRGLSVAGTHGKTTTSSLLTWVLHAAELKPSYAIGGIIPQLGSNGDLGEGDYFVAESCESDGTFTKYSPYGAILTNLDDDHISHYGSPTQMERAFRQFAYQVQSKQHFFWCADDMRLCALKIPGVSYGFKENCQLQGTRFRQEGERIFFDASFLGKDYPDIEVALQGFHNAQNALAVFGLLISLNVPEKAIREGLKQFKGVLRRMEKKGEWHGALIIDDYAHHPTEIKATLQALKGAYPQKRLVAVYQPHRYSRAKECFGTYRDCFQEADVLVATSLYAAGEEVDPSLSDEVLYKDITANFHKEHFFIPRDRLATWLNSYVQSNDVVATLGAGDITAVYRELA